MKTLNNKMGWISVWMFSTAAVLVFAGMTRQLPSNPAALQGSPVLKILENDIQTARSILSAEVDRIVILGRDDSRKMYRIANGILWFNGDPVLSGIESFHFEYRDAHENLLKPGSRRIRAVHTVSYIVVWDQDARNRHVNTRIVLDDPDSGEFSKVVWAYSSQR